MQSSFNANSKLTSFKNFEEAAESILRIMAEFIDINTLFIARNDKEINEIVKVTNREQKLLEEGSTSPFEETFCKLSVNNGQDILIIPDINESELSSSMEVTKKLGGGSFVGIPIYYEDGENYGTICGLDTKKVDFSEKHIELFRTMASLITHVIELDRANQQIENLSAPFVPIVNGVAVLPIIGFINEKRIEDITLSALTKSQDMSLEYLIIDLSGIVQINSLVSSSLLKIVNLLQLIGVTPILTGIRPDMAIKALEGYHDLQNIMIEANLERALQKIGFVLEKRS